MHSGKILVALFWVVSLLGCGNSKDDGQVPPAEQEVLMQEGSATLNGRSYSYVLPSSEHFSLVIALHGGGDSVESFAKYSGLSELAKARKTFGVLYPKGIDKHFNDGRAIQDATVDDVAFINDLIDSFKTKGATQVYVVGMSNGGLMTLRLAGEEVVAPKLDGIAVVSAVESVTSQRLFTANVAMPALFAVGTQDTAFLPDGSITNPLKQSEDRGEHITMAQMLASWQGRNSCNGLIETQRLDAVDDNTSLIRFDGVACAAPLRYYEIQDGGHRWPDVDAQNSNFLVKTLNLGYASKEISMAIAIASFFNL